MATHSSVLAWRIPGMGGPGGLPSMGSHRVGHNWSDLAAAAVLFHRSFPPGKGNSLLKKYWKMLPYVSMKFKGTAWLVPNSPRRRAGWKGCSGSPPHPTGGWTNLCASRGHTWKLWKGPEMASSWKGPQTDTMSPVVSWDNCLMRLFLIPGSGPSFFQGEEENIQDNMVDRLWY